MGARRTGMIKMGQRPHERKATSDGMLPGRHQAAGVKKKQNRRKKPLKIKVAEKQTQPATSGADAPMAETETDMFGMALAAPVRTAAFASADAPAAADAAAAAQQPRAFADADKNELFRRVISYSGTKHGLHPRDARRQHEELLKRQKEIRREQKNERFITKERKPFHTAVMPY